jgi:hypothetical protein
MDSNIKLLEERVFQLVGRLRELSAERKGLEEELRALRQRLESLEKGGPADSGPKKKDEVWRSRRAEAISAIRETLAELRGA